MYGWFVLCCLVHACAGLWLICFVSCLSFGCLFFFVYVCCLLFVVGCVCVGVFVAFLFAVILCVGRGEGGGSLTVFCVCCLSLCFIKKRLVCVVVLLFVLL